MKLHSIPFHSSIKLIRNSIIQMIFLYYIICSKYFEFHPMRFIRTWVVCGMSIDFDGTSCADQATKVHNVFDWVSIQIGYWQFMRSLSVQILLLCMALCTLPYVWLKSNRGWDHTNLLYLQIAKKNLRGKNF